MKVPTPHLFQVLKLVTDKMLAVGMRYTISGGTLLGCIRESQLIPYDKDIDIDILRSDCPRLLEILRDLDSFGISLLPDNIKIDSKQCLDYFKDPPPIIGVRHAGIKLGDIYVFSLFRDGIVRLVGRRLKIINPKMSLPIWFYDRPESHEINGYKFLTPSHPAFLLERLYGSDWTVPKDYSTVDRVVGRHSTSGALFDVSLESAVLFALRHGWTGNYDSFPAFTNEYTPQTGVSAASTYGETWLRRHELCFIDELADAFDIAELLRFDSFQLETWIRATITRAYAAGWDKQAVSTRKWRRHYHAAIAGQIIKK